LRVLDDLREGGLDVEEGLAQLSALDLLLDVACVRADRERRRARQQAASTTSGGTK
jgi:hypothetical protein